MIVPEINLSLEGILEACRCLHRAAKQEAAQAEKIAGTTAWCAVTPDLHQSYVNLLRQVQSQYSHPFIQGIPLAEESINPIQLPMLTAQLLECVRVLAAPMMTPQSIEAAWDGPLDAVYDSLEG